VIALLSVCLSVSLLVSSAMNFSANADNSSRTDLFLFSTEKRGGKPVQTTGARLSGRGSGPTSVAYFFVVVDSSRLYKLTLSDQAQFNLQLKVFSLSDSVYRFLNGPPLLGGGVRGRRAKSSFTGARPRSR